MDNPYFIPGDREHNFKVLKYLSQQENPPFVLLYVTENDIRNGKPGNIYECAISQAAKALFGKRRTVPTTKQIKGSLCLQISDDDNNTRYLLRLGRLNDPQGRGFDPEQYDIRHGHVRPGAVMVQAVEAGPRPVDLYPPAKRDPQSQGGSGSSTPTSQADIGLVAKGDSGSQEDVMERGDGDSLSRPTGIKRQPRVWTDSGTSIKGQDLYLRKKVMDDPDRVTEILTGKAESIVAEKIFS